MRPVTRVCLTFVMLALAAPTAFGQSWIGAGTPIVTVTGAQVGAKSCADGADGVYVAWVDFRGPDADLYLQHLDADGAERRRPDCRLQPGIELLPDRNAPLAAADGSVLGGWSANTGNAVCTESGDQWNPVLLAFVVPIGNPALRDVQGRITLASDADAELTLLDITGRVRHRQSIRGAGVHSLALAGTALEPGVYLAELRQSGDRTRTKFCVLR